MHLNKLIGEKVIVHFLNVDRFGHPNIRGQLLSADEIYLYLEVLDDIKDPYVVACPHHAVYQVEVVPDKDHKQTVLRIKTARQPQ